MSDRIHWVDNLKAITMLLVIAGHCSSVIAIPWAMQAIYAFHMPLFLIISGFFIKKENNIKGAKKLLNYYLSTALIISLYMIMFENSDVKTELLRIAWANGFTPGPDHCLFHSMPSISALWFLMALSVGKIVSNYMFWIKDNSWICYSCVFKDQSFYVSVILLLIAYYSSKYIRLPFCFQAGLLSVTYLYIGFLVRKFNFLKSIPAWYAIIGGTILLALNTRYGFPIVSICSFKIGLIEYFSSILICFAIIRICSFNLNYSNKLLSFIGKNTLIILCVHCTLDLFILPSIIAYPVVPWMFPIELSIRLSYILAISLLIIRIQSVKRHNWDAFLRHNYDDEIST